jgi:hypothetical protein
LAAAEVDYPEEPLDWRAVGDGARDASAAVRARRRGCRARRTSHVTEIARKNAKNRGLTPYPELSMGCRRTSDLPYTVEESGVLLSVECVFLAIRNSLTSCGTY